MSAQLYNKVYKSVQNNNSQFKNAEETIAFYLKAASKYVQKAVDARAQDDFEGRSKQSDDALMLLSGIMGAIDQFPNDDKQKMIHLNDYCIGITNCIVRMNIKDDAEMGKGIVKSLLKMAADWQRKSDLAFEKEQAKLNVGQTDIGEQNTNREHALSHQKTITSSQFRGLYPSSQHTPNTSIIG